MTGKKRNFSIIGRVIFALWIVPNPLGHIITNLPRSKGKNLVGLGATATIGGLSIYFILFAAPEISLKIAVSSIVGTLVVLAIFTVMRRIRKI